MKYFHIYFVQLFKKINNNNDSMDCNTTIINTALVSEFLDLTGDKYGLI